MILSDNRAKAVKDYLINKGVDASRMTSKGYGDTMPVATNKTAAGKTLNRRVEFVVTFEETVPQ
jgi:outer membrane protein OmpA-like peptidoglycan-associated protein